MAPTFSPQDYKGLSSLPLSPHLPPSLSSLQIHSQSKPQPEELPDPYLNSSEVTLVGSALGTLYVAMLPIQVCSNRSNTVCFNPPWVSSLTTQARDNHIQWQKATGATVGASL